MAHGHLPAVFGAVAKVGPVWSPVDLVPTGDEICCVLQLGWSNMALLEAAWAVLHPRGDTEFDSPEGQC